MWRRRYWHHRSRSHSARFWRADLERLHLYPIPLRLQRARRMAVLVAVLVTVLMTVLVAVLGGSSWDRRKRTTR